MKKTSTGEKFRVTDPIGNEVVLKTSTFDDHIIGSHSSGDSDIREKVLYFVPDVIENPDYIYTNEESSGRNRYISLVSAEFMTHISALVVITDTDRTPHEVVTYNIKRKLNQEKIGKGRLIYDRRKFKKQGSH